MMTPSTDYLFQQKFPQICSTKKTEQVNAAKEVDKYRPEQLRCSFLPVLAEKEILGSLVSPMH